MAFQKTVAITDMARISKYGTVAERPRSKLFPALVPSNELIPGKYIRCRLSGVIPALIAKLVGAQDSLDLLRRRIATPNRPSSSLGNEAPPPRVQPAQPR